MVVPPVQFDQDSYAHAKQTVLRMNEKKKETEIKRRGEMHGILGIHEQFHRIEVTLRTAGLRPGRENAIVDQVKDLENHCMTYVEEMETEAEMFYTLQKETLRKKMEKMQLLMDEATHSKKKVEECHAIEIKELEKSMQVAHYKAQEDMKVERVMLKEQHQAKYTTYIETYNAWKTEYEKRLEQSISQRVHHEKRRDTPEVSHQHRLHSAESDNDYDRTLHTRSRKLMEVG